MVIVPADSVPGRETFFPSLSHSSTPRLATFLFPMLPGRTHAETVREVDIRANSREHLVIIARITAILYFSPKAKLFSYKTSKNSTILCLVRVKKFDFYPS